MMPVAIVNNDEVVPSPEPRRASLERLRAVGQTFTDGIAALRDRVISAPTREHSQSPTDEEHSQIGNGEEKMSSSEVTFDEVHPQKDSLPIATPELESSLRSQIETLQSASDRTSKLLTSSRTQSDKLRQKLAEENGRANAAFADVARLRTQIVDVEHEMRALNQRADVAERGLVEEQKKTAALERVCMSLRRRAAIAETHAEDAKKMREAVVAREVAETNLAESKAEAEKWRIKSTATDVLRERAEAAERSERTLREKVDTLERELESRESLLRQNIVERRKLKEYMTKYERELEEKERRIVKLKRSMKKPPPMRNRRVRMNPRDFGDIDDHRAMSTDETDLESTASQTAHKNASIDADDTSRDWDIDQTIHSLDSAERNVSPNEAVSFVPGSPLLRDVEETHAQLQSIYKEDNEDGHGPVVDLMERVKRLEASFGALADVRGQSSRRTGSV